MRGGAASTRARAETRYRDLLWLDYLTIRAGRYDSGVTSAELARLRRIAYGLPPTERTVPR